jgi:hypothetical protein
MAQYTIKGSGNSHFVMDGEVPVLGPFVSHDRALDVRDELIRKERMRVRPCITCNTEFMSEGPHNRMCDACRAD